MLTFFAIKESKSPAGLRRLKKCPHGMSDKEKSHSAKRAALHSGGIRFDRNLPMSGRSLPQRRPGAAQHSSRTVTTPNSAGCTPKMGFACTLAKIRFAESGVAARHPSRAGTTPDCPAGAGTYSYFGAVLVSSISKIRFQNQAGCSRALAEILFKSNSCF